MNENNKAIDMLVDKIVSVTESKTQNLKYDKTFQSTVWKVNSDGTYGINYLGQMYNVPNASGFILTLGQKVWVKIPSGIFRNMIITGISGENSSTGGGTGGSVVSVNGKTGKVVLTTNDIENNSGYSVEMELTQAEYDALSEEEKMNGITYYITDAESNGGGSSGGGIDLSEYYTKEEVETLINQKISEINTGVLSISVNGVKVETDENGNVNLDISSSQELVFETEDIDFNTEYKES